MKISILNKKLIKRLLIVAFWLTAWGGVSQIVDNKILMAGPIDTFWALVQNVTNSDFIFTIFNSLFRIGLGFLVAFILGIGFGLLAFKCAIFREIFMPLINVIKAVPVASFVVLLLIWAGSSNLSFFISFLVSFPIVFISTEAGLKNADEKLISMAHTFSFSKWEIFLFIYRESLKPFVKSSVKSACGMAWKAGVAAEVIGLPKLTIGTQIYNSKIYLETDALFAWTLVVILLSFIFEKIFVFVLNLLFDFNPKVKQRKRSSLADNIFDNIFIEDIDVSYDNQVILQNVRCQFEKNSTYMLVGESGVGKTTLLNEIQKRCDFSVSRVFQENRLLESLDGMSNIMLCNDTVSCSIAEKEMRRLISEEDYLKPVCEYSGGMKRKIAILRSLFNGSRLVLMDEPFNGLDYDNKKEVIEIINQHKADRIFVIATHDMEAVELMKGIKIELKDATLHTF